MAIKYFEDEPRKDGYKGIRVSCTLDGKPIQEYFHQSKRVEAEARHAELMKQVAHRGSKTAQRQAQQYTYSAPRYDPPRRTGVVGLTIAFQAQKKCTPLRHYPVILIAHQDKTRKVSNITSRAITNKRNLESTWKESCQILAKWRDYNRVPSGWYALCPSVEDFKKLRRFYNKQGENIQLSNLDVMA